MEAQNRFLRYDDHLLEASDEDNLLRTGFSKDGKHQNSLIFLGLLVGFAIGYDIFEGNIYGGDTLIPVIKK